MRQLRRASSNANDEIPSRVPPFSLSKGPAGMQGIKMGVMVVEGRFHLQEVTKEWELSGSPNHDSTFLIWKGTWMRPVTVSSPVGDSESTKSVDLSGQACPLGKPVSREIQMTDKSLSGSTFLNQCFLLSPTHTSLCHPTTPQNKSEHYPVTESAASGLNPTSQSMDFREHSIAHRHTSPCCQ